MTVAELLADEKRWTRDLPSRNNEGHSVEVCSEDAVCWCMLGAIWKCYPLDEIVEIENRLRRVTGVSIASWNDEPCRTHAEVLAAVQKAGI